MNEGRVTTIQGESVRIRVNDAGQLELEMEDSILVFDYDSATELVAEIIIQLREHRRAEKLARLNEIHAEAVTNQRIAEEERAAAQAREAKSDYCWRGEVAHGMNSEIWEACTPPHYTKTEAAINVCHLVFSNGITSATAAEVREQLVADLTLCALGKKYRVVPVSLPKVD